MRKPLLVNSTEAKADFKALVRPGIFLKLNISGGQVEDSNYAEAEIAVPVAVPSEGLLSCGEPTCSAGSPSFGSTEPELKNRFHSENSPPPITQEPTKARSF